MSYEVRSAPDDWGVGVGCVGPGGMYWLLIGGDTAVVLLETRTVEVLATETIDRAPSSGRLRLACAKGVGADATNTSRHRNVCAT